MIFTDEMNSSKMKLKMALILFRREFCLRCKIQSRDRKGAENERVTGVTPLRSENNWLFLSTFYRDFLNRIRVLSLGCVYGVVYAAQENETPMPVANDVKITAPDQQCVWSFGASAAYMQPTNSMPNYAEKTGTSHDKSN